jgi:hypothetical protein
MSTEMRVVSGLFFFVGLAFLRLSAEAAGLVDVVFIRAHLASAPSAPSFLLAFGVAFTLLSFGGLWSSSRQ